MCTPIRPAISGEYFSRIISEFYQLKSNFFEILRSYDDFVCAFVDENGQKLVLKVISEDSSQRKNYQSFIGSLLELLHNSGITAPRIKPYADGVTKSDRQLVYVTAPNHGELCKGHVVHLLTYIEGESADELIRYKDRIPDSLVKELGTSLARVHQSLSSWKPEEGLALEPTKHGWELKEAHRILDVLSKTNLSEKRQQKVEDVIRGFTEVYNGAGKTFTQGLLHGDYLMSNILLDKSTLNVAGIIDFSEMCISPYVFDLATMIVSLATEDKIAERECDYVRYSDLFLKSYIDSQQTQLTTDDLQLLYHSIHARFAQYITLCLRDADLDPQNELYISGDIDATLQSWDSYSQLERDEILTIWNKHIQKNR